MYAGYINKEASSLPSHPTMSGSTDPFWGAASQPNQLAGKLCLAPNELFQGQPTFKGPSAALVPSRTEGPNPKTQERRPTPEVAVLKKPFSLVDLPTNILWMVINNLVPKKPLSLVDLPIDILCMVIDNLDIASGTCLRNTNTFFRDTIATPNLRYSTFYRKI